MNSDFMEQITGYGQQGWDIAKGWLLSPAAWSQFGLLVVAYIAAYFLARRFKPLLTRLLSPPE